MSFYGMNEDHPDYKKTYHETNLRAARCLLELSLINKGTYIKAGQQLASLDHALPAEFIQVLSVLQDRVEPRHFDEIRRTFEDQFGCGPHAIFDNFDEIPIAAASIAQVHHAYLKDGREVAVKVQYHDLEEMVKSDLLTITFLTGCLAKLFPQMQFSWILPEFKQAMAQELDFLNEGYNAERTRFNFMNESYIKIPDIHWEFSGPKVLTMEFIHGIKINDIEKLKEANFDTIEIADKLIKCFSQQIFIHGWIHADPHPGNLLVRRNQNQDTQIVILDHGLYSLFPTKLRLHFCKLFKAIIMIDQTNIDKYGRKLGCGEQANLFALILTFRPPSNTDVGLNNALTKEDFDEIRRMFGGKSRIDSVEMLNHLLEDVPREVLFVLRCMTHLRTINRALGAKVNRFEVMGKHAVKAIYLSSDSCLTSVKYWFQMVAFNLRLYFLVKLMYLYSFWFTIDHSLQEMQTGVSKLVLHKKNKKEEIKVEVKEEKPTFFHLDPKVT
jgi:aarF domain-containing kinase